jgi:hypothetical protein
MVIASAARSSCRSSQKATPRGAGARPRRPRSRSECAAIASDTHHSNAAKVLIPQPREVVKIRGVDDIVALRGGSHDDGVDNRRPRDGGKSLTSAFREALRHVLDVETLQVVRLAPAAAPPFSEHSSGERDPYAARTGEGGKIDRPLLRPLQCWRARRARAVQVLGAREESGITPPAGGHLRSCRGAAADLETLGGIGIIQRTECSGHRPARPRALDGEPPLGVEAADDPHPGLALGPVDLAEPALAPARARSRPGVSRTSWKAVAPGVGLPLRLPSPGRDVPALPASCPTRCSARSRDDARRGPGQLFAGKVPDRA